ncbi:MAG: hypothetical protein M3015_01160 [Bacteroidota bacterium]|nr:hypothetical protein [Bacteroidota bacterium]
MKRNILSIGSNNAMTHILKTTLGYSYHLISVEDIFKAMYLLKQKREIDIIIIDIDYQIKESIDFVLHVCTSKLYNQSLIVLSNLENKKHLHLLPQGSVYEYFIKPFDPIQLLHCINKLMTSISMSQISQQ